MKLATALKEAAKYHATAFVPSLIGGAIIAVSLWVGVVAPALAAVPGAAGGPEGLLEGLLAAQYNVPVVLVGVVGGMLIRRIGKTALLFKIHGTTVVDEVDDELIESDPASARPADSAHDESVDENDESDDEGDTDEDSDSATNDDGGDGDAETGPDADETAHRESGDGDGEVGSRSDETDETPPAGS